MLVGGKMTMNGRNSHPEENLGGTFISFPCFCMYLVIWDDCIQYEAVQRRLCLKFCGYWQKMLLIGATLSIWQLYIFPLWLTSANYPAALPQQLDLTEAFEEKQVTQKSICSPLVRSCIHTTHSMPKQPLAIETLQSGKKSNKFGQMNIMARYIRTINMVTAAMCCKTFLNLIKWFLCTANALMWLWQLCKKAHRQQFDCRLSLRLSGICPLW